MTSSVVPTDYEVIIETGKIYCQYEFQAGWIVVGRKWIPGRQRKLAFRN